MFFEGKVLVETAAKLSNNAVVIENIVQLCDQLGVPPGARDQLRRQMRSGKLSAYRLCRRILEIWESSVPTADLKKLCKVLNKLEIKLVAQDLKKCAKKSDIWNSNQEQVNSDQKQTPIQNTTNKVKKESTPAQPHPPLCDESSRFSEIRQLWNVTHRRWILHLCRHQIRTHHNHTFLILEGLQFGDSPVVTYFMDFVKNIPKPEELGQRIGKIRLKQYEGDLTAKLYNKWKRRLGKQEINPKSIRYFSWSLKAIVAQKLIQSVRELLVHPPKYYVVGEETLPTREGQLQPGEQEAHNCYTWAAQQFNSVLPRVVIPAEDRSYWIYGAKEKPGIRFPNFKKLRPRFVIYSKNPILQKNGGNKKKKYMSKKEENKFEIVLPESLVKGRSIPIGNLRKNFVLETLGDDEE